MESIALLKDEHRAIERMLAILEEASDRLAEGRSLRAALFREAVEFIQNFGDRCHHGKEEEILFPRLEAAGMPRDNGPLAVMLMEHDEGRAYVRQLSEAAAAMEGGEASAAAAVIENARAYVQLLRMHILKEDNVLFPLAQRLLTAEDDAELERRFEQAEAEVMGPGVHERYHELLDALEQELGLVRV
ncbi:MAG TPA: hemerythrin domain-containing protein [Dehalococcoidia bacterium]|nr:hemerythrin domain-containing protein [Dehalococcoidia bacterium]